jgi:predicted phosphodiesterase
VRIAVITDVHANLPALRAAIDSIQSEGCDALFHTGDSIGIGPCPAECLQLLLDTPRSYCVVGNHENWLVRGLPSPQPKWMTDGFVRHFRWTCDQIDHSLRSEVKNWPYVLTKEFDGIKAKFIHYALDKSGIEFMSVEDHPSSSRLDDDFDHCDAPIIFFGHYHRPVDDSGQRRYINPGSLGLNDEPIARYCVIDFKNGQHSVQHRTASYQDAELQEYFESRKVPGRDFIDRAFLGGRLGF